jgi:OmpA-OmpF porin, OOP family
MKPSGTFTRATIAWILVLVSLSVGAARGADVPGSRDHPLLKRYEGSRIYEYRSKAFDEFALPIGAFMGGAIPTRKLEGAVTTIVYLAPVGRSPLEVLRNYTDALQAEGYTILFEGRGAKELTTGLGNVTGHKTELGMLGGHSEQRFVALERRRPEGDVHVAIHALPAEYNLGWYTTHGIRTPIERGQVLFRVDVIESRPMEQKMVVVSADSMAQSLGAQGSVSLYGIYFDSGSARVDPASAETLGEIARLLQAQPGLTLLVVGHTDNVGEFDFNRELSQRRAAAVVEALVAGHRVARARLLPFGASFASPKASNRSEEGRAQNRRVELVER